MDKKYIKPKNGATISGPGVAIQRPGETTQPVQPGAEVQNTVQTPYGNYAPGTYRVGNGVLTVNGSYAGAPNPKSAGTTTTTTTTTSRPGVSAETAAALSGYEGGYQPSQAVQDAQAYLQQIMGQKPGDYQSPYAQQMQELYAQITGRGPFSYDMNADALYQQYKDQYTRMGQQAMKDTMGQAAGLTGGYGSTYSQNAGQQAYNAYLQQLNDKVPELYDRAYNAWLNEGNQLYQQYGMLGDLENQAYSRFRDTVGDWRSDLAAAYQQLGDERSFDYNNWSDMLSYWMNKANTENQDYWQQTQWDYQLGRDQIADQRYDTEWQHTLDREAVADSQWEREFAANQAYRNAQLAAQQAAAAQSSKEYKALLAQLEEMQKQQEILDKYHDPSYNAVAANSTPGGHGFQNFGANFSNGAIRIHGTPLNSVDAVMRYIDNNADSWSAAEYNRIQKELLAHGIYIYERDGGKSGGGAGTGWTSTTSHDR
jgi:hypothetical protein